MGQSDLINNRMVKFVVSYRIVFKQLEVSTILASVESWLHAGLRRCSLCPHTAAKNTSLLHHSILTAYYHTDTMPTSSLFP